MLPHLRVPSTIDVKELIQVLGSISFSLFSLHAEPLLHDDSGGDKRSELSMSQNAYRGTGFDPEMDGSLPHFRLWSSIFMKLLHIARLSLQSKSTRFVATHERRGCTNGVQ